ncbi:Response regulator receiver domain-containing protein [Halobiforma haloterrestris]|uniref:Response regulator receiver domain-containing protein n=1 Tax=Natronobacterium haloterrestre TaxID=148448 RepID=A0A1I1G5J7_NATHA|nr:response regulator [Halobiforma haloterrestris]SFC06835.1 Response regulator receiver domain-containing protein [Halobiforma haloterrestris]
MTGNGERVEILLVEDNPGDVRLIEEAFKELSITVTLEAVSDGDEGLDFLYERVEDAAASVPDFVLLDLNLPRMDGFEFLEAVRNDPDLARLPVLVLTSSKASDDVLESYELSANAYLTKPTDPDEYASMVQSVAEFWFKRAALPTLSA